MKSGKFFQLDYIKAGNRIIYPIVFLKFNSFKDTFFNLTYEVSAFKIVENKKIYYKNINLAQKDFEYVKSSFKD